MISLFSVKTHFDTFLILVGTATSDIVIRRDGVSVTDSLSSSTVKRVTRLHVFFFAK